VVAGEVVAPTNENNGVELLAQAIFGLIDIYNVNIFYEKIDLLTLELDTLKIVFQPDTIEPSVISTPIPFDKIRVIPAPDPVDTKSPTKGI
jgi:hypothetical protein